MYPADGSSQLGWGSADPAVVSDWLLLERNSQSLQISVRFSEKIQFCCSMRASPGATGSRSYCQGGVFKPACSHGDCQLTGNMFSSPGCCTPRGTGRGISNFSEQSAVFSIRSSLQAVSQSACFRCVPFLGSRGTETCAFPPASNTWIQL